MATQASTAQFTTRKVSATAWLIYDTEFPADDSRHVVAHVATDVLAEVTWARPVSLPTQYRTLQRRSARPRMLAQGSLARRPCARLAHRA